MIVPVMAISNLVLTQQIYSEETNGAHAHNRYRLPLSRCPISEQHQFFPDSINIRIRVKVMIIDKIS